MTQTPFDRGIRPWADPFWWAEQQLKLVTATATYLGRVAQACTGTTVVAPAETKRPEAPAAAPEAPAPEPGLPVAGWDELSLGSIRARLSRLSEADLVTLHAYEERHRARPDVLSMLANRLIKIRAS
jgi:hypothetical protein